MTALIHIGTLKAKRESLFETDSEQVSAAASVGFCVRCVLHAPVYAMARLMTRTDLLSVSRCMTGLPRHPASPVFLICGSGSYLGCYSAEMTEAGDPHTGSAGR
jgi:hypothetical protein